MNACKQIALRLFTNIENYEITIYGACEYTRQRITSRQACLCIFTHSPYLRITARPLVDGYTSSVYLKLDTTCQSVFDFHFNFLRNTSDEPDTALNTFTLTDRNYGLPIDGNLLFTQTE